MKKLICLYLAAALCLLASCGRDDYRRAEGAVWGTVYHITYRSDVSLDDSIVAEMQRVNMSLSLFEKQSLLSRLNSGATDSVDGYFERVYGEARRVWEASGCRFDPTVGPLVELWGFGSAGETPEPDSAAVARALGSVGMGRTAIVDGRLVRDEGVIFDFGAIAKGFGVDCVAAVLARNGCRDYMVEIGGEVAASGVNPHGKPWRIRIDSPADDGSGVEVLELADRCVATSGNYRNYRTRGDGSRLGHTIDPTTGYPRQGELASVTVVADRCVEADALATACMAMSADEISEMRRQRGDVEIIAVVARGDSLAVVRL